MATQTTKGSEQNQQRQGQAMTPGSAGQATPARRGAYLAGMSLSPADLFRMNPFSLMRRMTEEFGRADPGRTQGGARRGKGRHPRIREAVWQVLSRDPAPDGAKAADARARFENGVLEITVPMEEQRSQRREIPIEGSSGAGASGARDTSAGKPAGSTGSTGGSEKAA